MQYIKFCFFFKPKSEKERKIKIEGNDKLIEIKIPQNENENCSFYAKIICSKLKIKASDDYNILFRIENCDVYNEFKSIENEINTMIEIGQSFILIIEYIEYLKRFKHKELKKYKWMLWKWSIAVYDKELEYESIEYIQTLFKRTRLEIIDGITYKLNKIDMAMAVTMEMYNDNNGDLFDIQELEQEILYKYLPKWAQKQHSFKEWKQIILKITTRLGEMGLIKCDKLKYYTAYLSHVSNHRLYGMTLFGVRLVSPQKYNDDKFYFIGINWTNIVITNINKEIIEEWDIKQIKYLDIDEDKTKNFGKFRIQLNEKLFVPFQFYFFKVSHLEMFKHKVKELKMYIPKMDLSLF